MNTGCFFLLLQKDLNNGKSPFVMICSSKMFWIRLWDRRSKKLMLKCVLLKLEIYNFILIEYAQEWIDNMWAILLWVNGVFQKCWYHDTFSWSLYKLQFFQDIKVHSRIAYGISVLYNFVFWEFMYSDNKTKLWTLRISPVWMFPYQSFTFTFIKVHSEVVIIYKDTFFILSITINLGLAVTRLKLKILIYLKLGQRF